MAAGVRRVEAVLWKAAEDFINTETGCHQGGVRHTLKNPADIGKTIENLQAENASLKKHIEALEARQLVAIQNELLQKTRSSTT